MHVGLEMNLSSNTWKCDKKKSEWNVKDASISCLNLAHNIFIWVFLLNTFFISLKQKLKNNELKLHTLKNKKKNSIWPSKTIYKGGLLITFVSYFYQSASSFLRTTAFQPSFSFLSTACKELNEPLNYVW